MLRFAFNGGQVEIEDREATLRLLEFEIESRNRARETAEAAERAFMVVYRVGGDPDPSRPYNGLLTERLDISERTARQLITEGRIGYFCCGKKNYRVTERQVREYTGELLKAS
ncbi:hypothetical protein [Hymenobacter tenuis]